MKRFLKNNRAQVWKDDRVNNFELKAPSQIIFSHLCKPAAALG